MPAIFREETLDLSVTCCVSRSRVS